MTSDDAVTARVEPGVDAAVSPLSRRRVLVAGAAVAGASWVVPTVLGIGLPAAAAASAPPVSPQTVALARVLIVFFDTSGTFYSLAFEYYMGSFQAVPTTQSLGGASDPFGGGSDAGLLAAAGPFPASGSLGDYTTYFTVEPGSDTTSLTINVDTSGPYTFAAGIVATITVGSTVLAGYSTVSGPDIGPPDVIATYTGSSSIASSVTFTAPVSV